MAGIARRVVRRVTRGVVERLARAQGYTLASSDFWGPVPDVEQLPEATWTRPSPLRGVHFDPEEQMAYIERELAVCIAAFNPPRAPGAPGFFLDNGTYSSVDAEILYGMVRRHRPNKIIELGSGASTLVIAAALARNVEDGSSCSHLVFDPYPGTVAAFGAAEISTLADVRPAPVAAVPSEEFESLEAGDILFVDTSHSVKTGSDVNLIVLDILPRVQPGVLIHFHDIFLPWEYPRQWIEEHWAHWSEQYLVQAFLAFNDSFRVLVSAHAVARAFPDRLARVIPSWVGREADPEKAATATSGWRATLTRFRHAPRPVVTPAALWIVRTDPGV